MGTNYLKVDITEETAAEFQCSGKSSQEGESGMAKYGKQVSGWLDDAAGYVRKFDYKQADAGIREYVKQNPGRSLFIAGAVGLIIGAVLRRR